ncbi:hypothetical protein [Cytobacillus firmus]|uniref:hypothetical protein n=1 Tax=Cytobacillus firmus TaxID=1399 RepID=UPI0018CF9B04|nr:hypothetical protein [Cytobacillus firmus]MBG9445294.1 hypothetical protein [Cytobacillus firmus]MBY6052110.1 hypothetical protein [Cytobacillus firmus]MCS0654793.1 hypothetical protein [Cytobacillus firmus]MCU1807102.1 hypothetical protein [Cytobacillus firmus]
MAEFFAIISGIVIIGVFISNLDSAEDIEPSRGLIKFAFKSIYGLFTDTKRTLIKLGLLFGSLIILAISGLSIIMNL